MPKFYVNPDDRQQAQSSMSEDMFFVVHQPLLLAIANTKFGRDLLCIPQEYPRVVKMTKCSVHCLLEDNGETATLMADFRIGAKWANVIRYRWSQFSSYARYFEFRSPAVIQRETGISRLTSERLAVMADTLTAYPDPHTETSTFDGWAGNYVSTATYTFVQAHGLATGGNNNDSGVDIQNECSEVVGDIRWVIMRALFLFDTSSLTDDVTISNGVLTVTSHTVAVGDSDNDVYGYFAVVSATTASNTGVTNTDYAGFGTTLFSDKIDLTGMTTNTAYDFTMTAAGISGISKTGITKLGMRHGRDIEIQEPSQNSTNYQYWKSAETTGTSSDPKLVVTYTIASSGFINLPLLGVG